MSVGFAGIEVKRGPKYEASHGGHAAEAGNAATMDGCTASELLGSSLQSTGD